MFPSFLFNVFFPVFVKKGGKRPNKLQLDLTKYTWSYNGTDGGRTLYEQTSSLTWYKTGKLRGDSSSRDKWVPNVVTKSQKLPEVLVVTHRRIRMSTDPEWGGRI